MKVKKNVSTVWPFEVDELQTWAFCDSVFSPDECKKIIEIGNKNIIYKADIKAGYNKKIRDSYISWLYPSKDTDWIYYKLTDIILYLNSKFFKFNIYGFIEGLQFTSYQAPGGKYKKHVDRGLNSIIRKLSLSVQLSDPNSYKGGDLLIHEGDNPIFLPKEQGKLISFPSYVLHEVTPVTKGKRYSLVAWITGPQFK